MIINSMDKVCSKCHEAKEYGAFRNHLKAHDGYFPWCKQCEKEYLRAYYVTNKERLSEANKVYRLAHADEIAALNSKYYLDNKETFKARSKEYRQTNKEMLTGYRKEYYQKGVNREKSIARSRLYYQKNKPKCKAQQKAYNETNHERKIARNKEYYQKNKETLLEKHRIYNDKNKDKVAATLKIYRSKMDIQWWREYNAKYQRERLKIPKHNMDNRIRGGIYKSLKAKKEGRSWGYLVGYTLQDLIDHIEKNFLPGMSWDNIGMWHIDHVIPKSKFNYTSPEDLDFKRCWSLKNLQPLWGIENLKKRDKLDRPFQPALQLREVA